jgi:hypothetical protein
VISIEIDTRATPMSAHAKAYMKHGGVWLLTATTHKSVIVIDDDVQASDEFDNKQAATAAAATTDKTVTVEVSAIMAWVVHLCYSTKRSQVQTLLLTVKESTDQLAVARALL